MLLTKLLERAEEPSSFHHLLPQPLQTSRQTLQPTPELGSIVRGDLPVWQLVHDNFGLQNLAFDKSTSITELGI